MPQEAFQQFKDYVSQRQIERLWVVGSNEETAPIIDASYRRFLGAMDAHLANQPFTLGRRPGAGDFGLFGQLSQLVGFDPTSREIAHAVARTVGLIACRMAAADARGSDCRRRDQPASLKGEIGWSAPAQARCASCDGPGNRMRDRWREVAPTDFPYQAKCLQWTRDQYGQLSAADKARVDALIAGTGIEPMLEGVK